MAEYFSSDWHLTHSNILKFSNRPFSSIEENDSIILERMFKNIKKGDRFFFAGDLSFSKETLKYFFEKVLPKGIEFHWILGNHDIKIGFKEYSKYCASVSMIKDIKFITICHYPMISWNRSCYGSILVFGHHHKLSKGTELLDSIPGKKININCEFHNYYPWSKEEIIEESKNKSYGIDFVREQS